MSEEDLLFLMLAGALLVGGLGFIALISGKREERILQLKKEKKREENALKEMAERRRADEEEANDKEEHLDYDLAITLYEKIGDKESAKRVRKLKAEMGAVKVTQKVVHGDEVTKTEIKDSVLNRSNVGAGGRSKAEEIKEIKDLLDAGAIDDDEFKQMKKEILGK